MNIFIERDGIETLSLDIEPDLTLEGLYRLYKEQYPDIKSAGKFDFDDHLDKDELIRNIITDYNVKYIDVTIYSLGIDLENVECVKNGLTRTEEINFAGCIYNNIRKDGYCLECCVGQCNDKHNTSELHKIINKLDDDNIIMVCDDVSVTNHIASKISKSAVCLYPIYNVKSKDIEDYYHRNTFIRGFKYKRTKIDQQPLNTYSELKHSFIPDTTASNDALIEYASTYAYGVFSCITTEDFTAAMIQYGAVISGGFVTCAIKKYTDVNPIHDYKHCTQDVDIFSYSLDLLRWIIRNVENCKVRVKHLEGYCDCYRVYLNHRYYINYIHVRKYELEEYNAIGEYSQDIPGCSEDQPDLIKQISRMFDLDICCVTFDGDRIHYNHSLLTWKASGNTDHKRYQKYKNRGFNMDYVNIRNPNDSLYSTSLH